MATYCEEVLESSDDDKDMPERQGPITVEEFEALRIEFADVRELLRKHSIADMFAFVDAWRKWTKELRAENKAFRENMKELRAEVDVLRKKVADKDAEAEERKKLTEEMEEHRLWMKIQLNNASQKYAQAIRIVQALQKRHAAARTKDKDKDNSSVAVGVEIHDEGITFFSA